MGDDQSVYYIAHGKSHEACERMFAERERVTKKVKAFLRRIGAESECVIVEERLSSVRFKKPPDSGAWKKTNRGYWAPRHSTKAGKAIAAEMASLVVPGPKWLANELGVGSTISGMSMWSGVGVERLDDGRYILSKHEGQKGDPPGARKIKRSTYYRMKSE